MRVPQSKLESLIEIIILSLALTLAASFLSVLILKTSMPLEVVASNSMLHDSSSDQVYYSWLESNLNYSRQQIDSWPIRNGFARGDVIVAQGTSCSSVSVGDVALLSVPTNQVPLAHRVVKIHADGTFEMKADHNSEPLQFELNVNCSAILGTVVLILPKVGWLMLVLPLPVGFWLFVLFFAILVLARKVTKNHK